MTGPGSSLVISSTEGGISLSGEIDAHTAPRVAEAIAAVGASTIDVDMSGVEFVDSSGLRVLVDAHQRLEANGGGLRLVDASPAVRRLLEISGVDGYLGVE
jgi:anti-sigma B factor antagonist